MSITGANPGDFAIASNGCGATLAANASCAVSVTFTPSAGGTRVANLTFADNAAGNPHVVPLTGTGNGVAAPIASLQPAQGLTFLSQNIGTTSTTNGDDDDTGSAPMTVNTVDVTGVAAADYIVTNGCTAALAPNGSCNVSVAFRPTAAGQRTASLRFTDTAAGSPHSIPLNGTGATPPTAPALSLSATSLDFGSRNTTARRARRRTSRSRMPGPPR